jgi:cysteine-rich repeat protein
VISGIETAAAQDVSYVEPGGICGGNTPCTDRIQTAIDSATGETIIRVAEGAYPENVSVIGSVTLYIGWDQSFSTNAPDSPVILEGPAMCGNGIVEPYLEACDDKRDTAFCDADCTFPVCGDWYLNFAAGEQCDDGNTLSGDGCDAFCIFEVPAETAPLNLFNIGDSIGIAEAAYNNIGAANREAVWSTGWDPSDVVNSLNERFEKADPALYYENNSVMDAYLNQAKSGATMNGFAAQANAVVTAAVVTPAGTVGILTVLLGGNDVCAEDMQSMTDPVIFESRYRAGLTALALSDATRNAYIQVSGIPAIYWLWNAKRSDFWCRFFAWPLVPCENLLKNPENDCGSGDSHLKPDTIADDDGPDCVRRKQLHAAIRDVYNPILKNVLTEYKRNHLLPNAYYVDIFDLRFEGRHVNDGDCFHPSEEGQSLLADTAWCRSPWGAGDALCIP